PDKEVGSWAPVLRWIRRSEQDARIEQDGPCDEHRGRQAELDDRRVVPGEPDHGTRVDAVTQAQVAPASAPRAGAKERLGYRRDGDAERYRAEHVARHERGLDADLRVRLLGFDLEGGELADIDELVVVANRDFHGGCPRVLEYGLEAPDTVGLLGNK